jgi:hypothetical protein
MGILTKKYRLFWITETKEIINNYQNNYFNSVTTYPDSESKSYFESDDYQDILDKINVEGLKKQIIPPPVPPPGPPPIPPLINPPV